MALGHPHCWGSQESEDTQKVSGQTRLGGFQDTSSTKQTQKALSGGDGRNATMQIVKNQTSECKTRHSVLFSPLCA